MSLSSFTAWETTVPTRAARTDDRVLRLDRAQYAAGESPCLAAAESRRPVRVTINGELRQWAEFLTAAQEERVLDTLSAVAARSRQPVSVPIRH
jgi:hypothetical protein